MLNQSTIDFEGFFSVPLVLKFMVEDPEGIAALRNLKLVMFGGSPLSEEIGDKLVENGVRLVGHYGTSELRSLLWKGDIYLLLAEVGQVHDLKLKLIYCLIYTRSGLHSETLRPIKSGATFELLVRWLTNILHSNTKAMVLVK